MSLRTSDGVTSTDDIDGGKLAYCEKPEHQTEGLTPPTYDIEVTTTIVEE